MVAKTAEKTEVHRTHDDTTFDAVIQETMQRIVLSNNLAALKPTERMEYYSGVCKSLRLNPLTKPFEYLELPDREKGKDQNGNPATKLVLYATKSCTDQLRMIYGITITVTDKTFANGLYVVTAKAKTPDGREDEDIGAVPVEREGGEWKSTDKGKRYFQGNGKMVPVTGDALANALLKSITKAKRRVTLSICGLGMLDESEIESIAGAKPMSGEHGNGDSSPGTQEEQVTWIDEYATAVTNAIDEESIKLAEFQARGTFDKLPQPEKDKLKTKLLHIKGLKEKKLAEFANSPEAIAAKRAVIDKMVDEFGQERFLQMAGELNLRGDSDGWTLEQLNAVSQKLKGEPW